jgi:hypothetical protein
MTSLLKTTTRAGAPLDASGGDSQTPQVSDFLTIQSLGLINTLVLASAVVGASVVTRSGP